MNQWDVLIIGGGAAGFFAAIRCAELHPEKKIVILERQGNFLNKVRISGGGRCNVTHHLFEPASFTQNYPRGGKFLKTTFRHFQAADTVSWFEKRGVALKTEEDGRMFPRTNKSETVINCLMEEALNKNIVLKDSTQVKEIVYRNEDIYKFLIHTNRQSFEAKKLLIASGGYPKVGQYEYISNLGVTIVPPVPSLFTFHIKDAALHELSGISIPKVIVKIQGSKTIYEGPLLITHWGLSGPAILKTSAWQAIELNEKNYIFTISVNFLSQNEDDVREHLISARNQHPNKSILNVKFPEISIRLWEYILERAEIDLNSQLQQLSNKHINKLTEILTHCIFEVNGKSANKDEFVTAGGVDLRMVDNDTMESKEVQDLYFAGEILNIDGITGGFNFQAAWSTGFIAGSHL